MADSVSVEANPANGTSAVNTIVTVLKLLIFPAVVLIAFYLYKSFLYEPRHVERRIEDLTVISDALKSFRKNTGRYPTTPAGDWVGLHNAWGRSQEDWIEGLVPEYLAALPRDPRRDANGSHQYLYRSDGLDFKVLTFYPEDDCAYVKRHRPELLDPIRGGSGQYQCHAYGFWSSGGARW